MSESEQRGRCRQQLEAWYANNSSSVPRYSWMIADAIDAILSRAGSPPSQTAPWWLTDEERAEIKHLLLIQRHNTGWTTERHAELDALLSRAGSPPVVEVPPLGFLGDMTGREQGIVLAYRDALDAAGVAWKVVPRE